MPGRQLFVVVNLHCTAKIFTHTEYLLLNLCQARSTIEEENKGRKKKDLELPSKEMNLSREESYYEWLTLKMLLETNIMQITPAEQSFCNARKSWMP